MKEVFSSSWTYQTYRKQGNWNRRFTSLQAHKVSFLSRQRCHDVVEYAFQPLGYLFETLALSSRCRIRCRNHLVSASCGRGFTLKRLPEACRWQARSAT